MYGQYPYNTTPYLNAFQQMQYPCQQNVPMSQYQNQQPQQNQPQIQTNTNKVFVNGIDDVRNRQMPFNSDFIFLDNDKPILYQKIVDGKGQFEVKAFTITPYNPQIQEKTEQGIDLSSYVKTSEFEALKEEIRSIKERMSAKPTGVPNGTTKV